MIDRIEEASFEDRVLKADGTVVVDFSAAWCGPCKLQKPILERFGSDNPDVSIVEVDVDESPALATRLDVKAMPTLMVFRNGERVARAVAVQSGTKLSKLVG